MTLNITSKAPAGSETVAEARMGENLIRVYRFILTMGREAYVTEIEKVNSTKILLAEAPALLQSTEEDLYLDDFRVGQGKGSNFITGRVTGENFEMIQVGGKGIIRLTPNASPVLPKLFSDESLFIPNTNAHILQALIGNFVVETPHTLKCNPNLNTVEIRMDKTLVLFEVGAFYEHELTGEEAGSTAFDAQQLVYWTGKMQVAVKAEDPNFLEFQGKGKVYLSLSS